MGKKYWSKLVPNCTCEVIGGPDSQGLSLGFITDLSYAPDPFASVLNLAEGWSDVEVVPVPELMPNTGYLVIGPYRSNEDISYSFHLTETQAAVTASRVGAFGYVPIAIPRYLVSTEVLG